MKSEKEHWPDNIYILIPSFMSGSSLDKLLPEILEYAPPENIYVVDDGSTDDTEKICVKNSVEYIKHKINSGKGAALKTGFSHVLEKNSRWIITIDADGQHRPNDISGFLKKAVSQKKDGIIIGKRKKTAGNMPFERILSNLITSAICSMLTGQYIEDSQSGFRMYSSEMLKNITLKYNHFEMETEIILKAARLGWRISFIPVQTLYFSRNSNISHLKDTLRWVWSVIDIKINQLLKIK